jgi:hypothetical protein
MSHYSRHLKRWHPPVQQRFVALHLSPILIQDARSCLDSKLSLSWLEEVKSSQIQVSIKSNQHKVSMKSASSQISMKSALSQISMKSASNKISVKSASSQVSIK